MSKFTIIFVVLVLFSFLESESVLADRLLIGIDFVGYGYIDDTNERKGKDVYFERCNLVDQEKSIDDKTGDFETDECGDEGAREGSKVDLQSLPNISLEIGITHRYDMAGILLMFVCFAFQSRNVEKVDNQKAILLGASIAFSAMCAVIISIALFRGIPLDIPPMIATGTLAALSFWSRSKLS